MGSKISSVFRSRVGVIAAAAIYKLAGFVWLVAQLMEEPSQAASSSSSEEGEDELEVLEIGNYEVSMSVFELSLKKLMEDDNC